jgi:hypothetical protein
MYVVRPENNIHPWVLFFQRIDYVLLLHHTPTDAHNKIGTGFLNFFELPKRPEKSLIRILSYAACIDDDDVRVTFFITLCKTHFRKQARNRF